ncbi:MAG: zinc-binding dehydrogenase [Alphaproteobacteria bacterium]|nr:zinc-binding dehydrogenase [Rickettsiales bacterium]
MFAIITNNIGLASAVKLADISAPIKMGNEDIFIEHTAFGFNHEDFAIAMGRYPFGYYNKMLQAASNKILGLEATGTIIKVGSKVKHLQNGQRVFYTVGSLGSFCQKRVIHNSFVQPIPDNISNDTVVSCMRKGLMVHSLLYKTVSIQKNSTLMVHNATDPLEQILCSWASNVGLNVIGTVTKDEDKAIAKANGCQLVINREKENVVQIVSDHTEKKGVKIVFDSIGQGVEKESISCLGPFGIYIHYHSKNSFPNISASSLAPKSLFLTTPSLELYKSNKTDLISGTDAVFKAIEKKYIKLPFTRVPIKNAHKIFQSYQDGNIDKNYILIP